MIKECKKHGLTEFVIRKDESCRCKKCAVEAVQKRRNDLKSLAVKYKGGKCEKCGYDKYVGALDFHHVNDDKEFSVGMKGYTRSWENVKLELDKCVLLCANCHRETHGGIIDISDLNVKNHIEVSDVHILKQTYCIDCGTGIDRKATRCLKCSKLFRANKNKPSKEILIEELKNTSFVTLGKKYSVSDNTIRKWIK